jgi:hypothetical protein
MEIREKEVAQVRDRAEESRTSGRGEQPVAPPKKLSPPPTKANMSGPFSGCQIKILAIH